MSEKTEPVVDVRDDLKDESPKEVAVPKRDPLPKLEPDAEVVPDVVPEFSVPEKYRDSGWAEKLKSEEDLWTQLSHLQGLVGKKTVPFDFAKATPAQIEEYKEEARPSSEKEYVFTEEDVNTDEQQKLAQILYEAGISKHQGEQLIKSYSAAQKETLDSLFSKEDHSNNLRELFGEDHIEKEGSTLGFMHKHMNDSDQKVLNGLPNEQLKLFYKFASRVKESYGVTDSGKSMLGRPGSVVESVSTMVSKLRIEIDQATNNPAMKKELVDKLVKIKQQTLRGNR